MFTAETRLNLDLLSSEKKKRATSCGESTTDRQLTGGFFGSTCGSSRKCAASRMRFTAPTRKPSTPFPSQKRIIS